MELHFSKSHLSITQFPTTQLPDFTLITGPNGAGKSHLLQAIHNGSVVTDVAAAPPNSSTDIRIFDWNTLVPQDSGQFSSEQLRGERFSLFQQVTNIKNEQNALENIRSIYRSAELPSEIIENPAELFRFSDAEAKKLFKKTADFRLFLDRVTVAANQLDADIASRVDHNLRNILISLSHYYKMPLISITQEEFLEAPVENWGRSDLFQQSLSRLFVAYREAYLSNLLSKLDAKHRKIKSNYMNDREFTETFGPPPWDFVNHTLTQAGLDFEIDHPILHRSDPYNPRLSKRSSGTQISFNNLSSGEKILMSLAFCVYYSTDRRQIASYPKLLLFDEIDAPLHPTMTKNLVDTITNTLVGTFGIRVIATTHSPSTVALSPEESIHVMEPNKVGLRKISKAQALNILTVGVPTISISFDGRRQVLVESPADAQTYDSLYKVLRPHLASERSLEFIATGSRSTTGEERNTGCDVVKRLVKSLADAGNTSVLGLIDWDGTNEPEDRISVIAHNRRNGIENIVFDPLAIACLICRDCPEHQAKIGIEAGLSFFDFSRNSVSEFQVVVNKICSDIFGDSASSTFAAKYVGGMELQIDQRYLQLDDHNLEDRLVKTYPFLKAISKGGQAGVFLQHVIRSVFRDKPEFVPIELKVAFDELLEKQI